MYVVQTLSSVCSPSTLRYLQPQPFSRPPSVQEPTTTDDGQHPQSQNSNLGGSTNGYHSDSDDSKNDGATEQPSSKVNNGIIEANEGEGGHGEVSDRDHSPKPRPTGSLLAEPHIRIILFTQGMYSVRGDVFSVLLAKPRAESYYTVRVLFRISFTLTIPRCLRFLARVVKDISRTESYIDRRGCCTMSPG